MTLRRQNRRQAASVVDTTVSIDQLRISLPHLIGVNPSEVGELIKKQLASAQLELPKRNHTIPQVAIRTISMMRHETTNSLAARIAQSIVDQVNSTTRMGGAK
jgi:hypothetical protein